MRFISSRVLIDLPAQMALLRAELGASHETPPVLEQLTMIDSFGGVSRHCIWDELLYS